jgi:integrase
LLFSSFRDEILNLVKPQVSKNTYTAYRLAFAKWFQLMGDTELESITPKNVELFKNRYLAQTEKNGKGGLSIYFRALRSCINKGRAMGLVNVDNPFKQSASVKLDVTVPEYITEDEHKLILAHVKGHGEVRTESLKRLFTFLFHTGMRSGEAIAVKVEDIDMENKTVTVRAPKTNTVRGIPLNSVALHAVKRQIERRGITSGRLWNYTVSGASHAFLDAKKAAGITKDISFYSYRHSFASRALKKKATIYDVSKILGHQQLSTTMKFYASFDIEQLRAVVALLE